MPARAPGRDASLNSDESLRAGIEQLCAPGGITAVVQPVVRTADQLIIGYEALARMPVLPTHSPDWWLAEAERFGLRRQLEIACLRAASDLGAIPQGRLLFVNASPSVLADPAALAVIDDLPQRLVVELTEQEAVTDYDVLRIDLAYWLGRGARIAVDDTGAGYSSLRHLIELNPDFLKLDRGLVAGIETDRNRQALVRSIVAFAREVGTSIIAEGVETIGEFRILRDAGVHLVQGYLLAAPGAPWPVISTNVEAPGVRSHHPHSSEESRLRSELAAAQDVKGACSVVVEHLFRWGQVMPSVYLERRGELRCVAQRGLWQVLDGMPERAGITGRTWSSGRAIVIEDVTADPDYLEAIPGVVAEICVPIELAGRCIGAMNIESLVPLPGRTLEYLERCAILLGSRLSELGVSTDGSGWHRAMRASVAISGLTHRRQLPSELLTCVRGASVLDSAALILDGDDDRRVICAIGPLAASMTALSVAELDSISSLVSSVQSCYTAGDAAGRGFSGSESLRDAGARSVVVLPLWARRRRLGSLLLAHSKPVQLDGDDVGPLEMLADEVAAVLAGGVDGPQRARRQAARLPLLDEEMRALEALLVEPPSPASELSH